MVTITFKFADGSEQQVEAAVGSSVMQAAVHADVPGIIGECGGSLACATCHCYVAPDWFAKVSDYGPGEEGMLDMAMAPPRPESRLSCQIVVTEALDGLVLTVPEENL